jgi:hypothetical protein
MGVSGSAMEIKKPPVGWLFTWFVVPRKGLEPPRCYSLVPETSASTNSATWAFQERKALYQKNECIQQLAGRI